MAVHNRGRGIHDRQPHTAKHRQSRREPHRHLAKQRMPSMLSPTVANAGSKATMHGTHMCTDRIMTVNPPLPL